MADTLVDDNFETQNTGTKMQFNQTTRIIFLIFLSSASIIDGFAFSKSSVLSRSMLTNASTKSLYLSTTSAAGTNSAAEILPPDYSAVYKKTLSMLEGKIPPDMEETLLHFVTEYFTAASNNPSASPEQTAKCILEALEYSAALGLGENKFKFGNFHKAVRANSEHNPMPNVDFSDFGINFFKNAINLPNSVILGEENLRRAFEKIKAGENVVFLANHQSEADPQVISILLESIGLEEEAGEITYVAGHKVTTDALAIPFSMGRNLLCIHSKKHIDADPETKPAKQKQNLASMSAMLGLMKKGGCSLWVAPSGGRDRRNVETGEVPIATFDQKTIDMFRLMGNKSKVKTHFFPLAMVSYELCPPPDFLEAGVGEKRNIRFSPIGIAVGKEVPNVGGVDSRHLFTEHAFEECQQDYEKLLKAIEEKDIAAKPRPPPL